ncbi:MAG TPA: hypothetical protein VGS41_12695 [Chthonomonadales bacterium]|nr:hypothetical protein [Chthonomonadales bacterium]
MTDANAEASSMIAAGMQYEWINNGAWDSTYSGPATNAIIAASGANGPLSAIVAADCTGSLTAADMDSIIQLNADHPDGALWVSPTAGNPEMVFGAYQANVFGNPDTWNAILKKWQTRGIPIFFVPTLRLAPLPATPSVSATSGGSVAVGTYYTVLTYVFASGETDPSAANTGTTIAVCSGAYTLTVTHPTVVPGESGYNIYMGTSSTGPYYLQNSSPYGKNMNYALGTTPSSSGTNPPTGGAGSVPTGTPTPPDAMGHAIRRPYAQRGARAVGVPGSSGLHRQPLRKAQAVSPVAAVLVRNG